MFERYTERSRRAIFFARYEASQYGSPKIETEHLLLGLIRENRALFRGVLRSSEPLEEQLRATLQKAPRISTSVEMPLTEECRRVLQFAAEEADRLATQHVDTAHLVLGILREEKSKAASFLRVSGITRASVVDWLMRGGAAERTQKSILEICQMAETAWNNTDATRLSELFDANAEVIDWTGVRWKGPAEIEKCFAQLRSSFGDKIKLQNPEPGFRLLGRQAAMLSGIIQNESRHGKSLRVMAVYTAREGQWIISAIQFTEIHSQASSAPPKTA